MPGCMGVVLQGASNMDKTQNTLANDVTIALPKGERRA